MKIFQLCDEWRNGGAENVFSATVDLLSELGSHEIVPIYAGKPNLKWSRSFILGNSENSRLFEKIPIYSMENFKAITNRLKEEKVDIIHLHGIFSKLTPSVLCAIKNLKKYKKFKLVETVHSYTMVCPNGPLYSYSAEQVCNKCVGQKIKTGIFHNNCDRRGWAFSCGKGLRSLILNNLIGHANIVDKFIAPSEFMRQKLICEGIDGRKIEVIRNPANLLESESVGDFSKKDEIIYFGRFSPEKNLNLLIEAFSILINDSRFLNYRLKLIGDGESSNEIKELVCRFSISERVDIFGFLSGSKLWQEVGTAKIFVLPSKCYENAPLSIVEASLLSVIPVVSNIGGISELQKLLGVGDVFESNNVEDLVRVIKKVLSNYLSYFRFMQERNSEIKNIFDRRNYANKLSELYESVLRS